MKIPHLFRERNQSHSRRSLRANHVHIYLGDQQRRAHHVHPPFVWHKEDNRGWGGVANNSNYSSINKQKGCGTERNRNVGNRNSIGYERTMLER